MNRLVLVSLRHRAVRDDGGTDQNLKRVRAPHSTLIYESLPQRLKSPSPRSLVPAAAAANLQLQRILSIACQSAI